MIETAKKLSKQWHEGQTDKAGKPYWTHPARVAENLLSWPGFEHLSSEDQESAVCAAYLHDTIEDCGVTPEQLRNEGFSEDTLTAVLLLSKNHEYTTIEAYCTRINAHPLARAVKLADLSDNCNKQREAELRSLGVTIDETKYPKVLAMLNPRQEESAWFEQAILKDITN